MVRSMFAVAKVPWLRYPTATNSSSSRLFPGGKVLLGGKVALGPQCHGHASSIVTTHLSLLGRC